MTIINYAALPGLRGKPTLPIASKRRVEFIETLVADYFDLTVEKIRVKSRKRYINDPRQITMYLVRKHTKLSLKEVADRIGGRDHTTVIHGVKHIKHLMETDSLVRSQVEYLESQILS